MASWIRPLLPHEHGAWGILAIPLLIGTALVPVTTEHYNTLAVPGTGDALYSILVTGTVALWVCTFALFLLRTAFLRWLKGSPLAPLRGGIYLCGGITLAAGLPLLAMGRWGLLWPLSAGFVASILEARWPAWTKRYRLFRHWTDIAVLTALAPSVVYAGTGHVGRNGWLAWALCFAYFGWRTLIVRGRVQTLIAEKRFSDIQRTGWREVGYSFVFAALTVMLLTLGSS